MKLAEQKKKWSVGDTNTPQTQTIEFKRGIVQNYRGLRSSSLTIYVSGWPAVSVPLHLRWPGPTTFFFLRWRHYYPLSTIGINWLLISVIYYASTFLYFSSFFSSSRLLLLTTLFLSLFALPIFFLFLFH